MKSFRSSKDNGFILSKQFNRGYNLSTGQASKLYKGLNLSIQATGQTNSDQLYLK